MKSSTAGRSAYVCILNWNGAALSLRCAAHALAQDYLSRKVVIIDNGSRAEDLIKLRAGIPEGCDLVELRAAWASQKA